MSAELLLIWVALVVGGVLLSALCSGVETGVYSLNRVRLALRVARGERRALLLRDEIDHPNRLLAALLIANTIANDVVSIAISRLFDGFGLGAVAAVVVNTLVVVPLLFVFGEVVPKDLFRRIADQAVLALAPLLRAARLLLTWSGLVPLVQLVSTAMLRRLGSSSETPLSSRQRLASIFEEGAGSGALTEEQVSLAERVVGMAGRTVTERMVPWRRVVTLRANDAPRAAEPILRTRRFSRHPVIDGTGRVVGVVSALDCLTTKEGRIADVVRPACWVGPSTTLLEALEALRRARAKMAIVGTPNGQPLGLVALNDLVEPLVGAYEGDL